MTKSPVTVADDKQCSDPRKNNSHITTYDEMPVHSVSKASNINSSSYNL